ncbi:MAG: sulfatase, partial [Gemmatimonadaceae bacterium]
MTSNSATIVLPPRAPLRRALDVLAIAVSAGIAAGWIHTLELMVARHLQHQLVWFSRDFIWMSPISYTLVMLPATLILAVVAVASRSSKVPVVSVFGLSCVAIFGVLLPYSQLARIAALLLAAGVAVQLARSVNAAPERWLSRFRRLALGGSVVVTLMALVLPRWRDLAANRAIDALPEVTATAPPANVLLIILDTVRAASMSLYGATDSTTPRLEQWAREGTVFDAAYSVAPWTLPSHASLFTGRYAGEVTADWKTPLDRSDSTLAELFRVRGYATGGFMANMHYTAWDSGLNRGFAAYEDYRTSWWQLLRSSAYTQTQLFDQLRSVSSLGAATTAILHPDLSIDFKHVFDRKFATEVSQEFLDWQAGVGQRPFFAVLNYFDAHQPYYAPTAFQHFARTPHYSAALAYLDANLDSIFLELRARNVLDNTIVLVTSDHGELFDEHGLSGHAH